MAPLKAVLPEAENGLPPLVHTVHYNADLDVLGALKIDEPRRPGGPRGHQGHVPGDSGGDPQGRNFLVFGDDQAAGPLFRGAPGLDVLRENELLAPLPPVTGFLEDHLANEDREAMPLISYNQGDPVVSEGEGEALSCEQAGRSRRQPRAAGRQMESDLGGLLRVLHHLQDGPRRSLPDPESALSGQMAQKTPQGREIRVRLETPIEERAQLTPAFGPPFPVRTRFGDPPPHPPVGSPGLPEERGTAQEQESGEPPQVMHPRGGHHPLLIGGPAPPPGEGQYIQPLPPGRKLLRPRSHGPGVRPLGEPE